MEEQILFARADRELANLLREEEKKHCIFLFPKTFSKRITGNQQIGLVKKKKSEDFILRKELCIVEFKFILRLLTRPSAPPRTGAEAFLSSDCGR